MKRGKKTARKVIVALIRALTKVLIVVVSKAIIYVIANLLH